MSGGRSKDRIFEERKFAMKRYLSIVVAFALALSLLPGTALAAQTAEPETLEDAAVLLTEDAAPAEEAGTEAADDADQEELALNEPVRQAQALEALAGTGDEAELLAAGATVSGKVSLPAGASADGDSYLYVYLYTKPILDEDGQVLSEASFAKGSGRVDIAEGQSSVSYTISNVEPGEYVLYMISYPNSAGALGGSIYYSADGAAAENAYSAAPLTVTAGSSNTVDLILPAATRSISGTLTFDTPAQEDTDIRVYLNDVNTSNRYYANVTVERGASSADFSLGVEPGTYMVQFRNTETGAYGYASIDGTVSTNFSRRIYVSTLDGSVTGLNQNDSSLLGSSAEADLTEVTVKLPAALTEDRTYGVFLADSEGNFLESSSGTVAAGQSSFTRSLSIEKGETFCVGYFDASDCSTYWSLPTDARYAAEEGVTSQVSKAAVFVGGTDTAVTLTEPACYTVTGTLDRSNLTADVKMAGYVLARFTDGETYAARVLLPAGTSAAQYTIYVPQSQRGGSFQLSAGKARGNTDDQVLTTSLVSGGSYTLSGNTQADQISFPEAAPTIQGQVSLPAGVTAPEGGLAVTLGVTEGYANTDYATYYLPEGQSSFHYALYAPVQGSATVYAELSNAPAGIYEQTTGVFSDLSNADLTFAETVTVSGILSVPEDCRDGVATVQVYANGTRSGGSVYGSTYVSILSGQVSAPYSLALPKGAVLAWLYVRATGDTQDALSTTSLYLNADLKTFVETYTSLSASINSDLTVNAALAKGAFVTGTISLADGLAPGQYSGRVRVAPVSGGSSYSASIDFNGTSCDYKISLPQGAAGEYYISVYMYAGVGTVLNQYYYYSESGMTADQSAAAPIQVDENGAKADLTIPKAKLISGKLTANDGSAVAWDPDETMNFTLASTNGSGNKRYSVQVDAQGNWTIPVASDLTGEFKLYVSFSSSVQTNIVYAYTYYYSDAGQSVTSLGDATPITLGDEDLTGLKLYVETGWVLSGSILLPEGGYLTGGTVTLTVDARTHTDSGTVTYSGSGTVGETGGSYFIVVPKTEDWYGIGAQSLYSAPSGISTNIYFGATTQTLLTDTITGDTDGLDITLNKAQTVITGTVYRPEGVSGSLSMTIYAQVFVDAGSYTYTSYSTSVNIGSNQSSASFSIAIPQSETGETYWLYYTSYSSGILANRDVYLCEDGALSTDYDQAERFSLAESPVHAFTPMTVEPFATGKIYCPEELTGIIEVYVDFTPVSYASTYDMSDTAVYVYVGPNIGQKDADGRWYSTYSLSDPNMTPGSTYRLHVYSNDNSSVVDTAFRYINQDGSTTKSYTQADIHTVPSSGSNVVDFTLPCWNDGSENYVLQSEHGIDSSIGTVTYTYTYPADAEALNVTFSSRTDAALTVNGSSYGSSLAGQTVQVTGNTLTVTMTPTNSAYNKIYGFAVERVEPVNGAEITAPAVAAVYTPSGSSEAIIMDDLRSGEAVRVSLVSGSISPETTTLLGVLYDASGRMLETVLVPVDLSDGSDTASLSFEEYGEAVTFKLLLTDGVWIPQMKNLTFQAP